MNRWLIHICKHRTKIFTLSLLIMFMLAVFLEQGERKFHDFSLPGTKVPCYVCGRPTFAVGKESSRGRKFEGTMMKCVTVNTASQQLLTLATITFSLWQNVTSFHNTTIWTYPLYRQNCITFICLQYFVWSIRKLEMGQFIWKITPDHKWVWSINGAPWINPRTQADQSTTFTKD